MMQGQKNIKLIDSFRNWADNCEKKWTKTGILKLNYLCKNCTFVLSMKLELSMHCKFIHSIKIPMKQQ